MKPSNGSWPDRARQSLPSRLERSRLRRLFRTQPALPAAKRRDVGRLRGRYRVSAGLTLIENAGNATVLRPSLTVMTMLE